MTNDFITRANMVSNILNILAWVMLVVGGLVAFFAAVGLIMDGDVLYGLFWGVIIFAGAAVQWALVQLGSLLAGYISQKV
jgi:hypothetical protein